MKRRFIVLSALSTALLVTACSDTPGDDTAATQTADTQASVADSGNGWSVPYTAWGDPDLSGKWPLEAVGGTPMQRPAQLGEKAYLTAAEYADALERAADSASLYQQELQGGRIGNGHWLERGPPLRQTSLIMEPANGRIPVMTELGLARAATMKSSWSEEIFDELSDFNPLDRCITRGLPASMIPFPYNNGVEIFQAPDYVASASNWSMKPASSRSITGRRPRNRSNTGWESHGDIGTVIRSSSRQRTLTGSQPWSSSARATCRYLRAPPCT